MVVVGCARQFTVWHGRTLRMTLESRYLTQSRHMPWKTLADSFASPGREWMIDCVVGDNSYSKRVGWNSSVDRSPIIDHPHHAQGLQVGPVYVENYSAIQAARAAEQRLETTHVARSEFRIDVDMTDFVELRDACGCGQDKSKMCASCWISLGHVGRYLITCLRAAFGLERIAAVFSGGRGLHLWVGDTRAQTWSSGMRHNVMDVLIDPPLDVLPASCREARLCIPSEKLYLDRNVSEQRGHLLRTPFTPHHSSKFIATPVSLFDQGWTAWTRRFESSSSSILIPSVPGILAEDPEHLKALERGVALWTSVWIRSPTT